MVLWKKESVGNASMYVDLMGLHNQSVDTAIGLYLAHNLVSGKCNAKSTELRMLGNKEFQAKNWSNAMELYNQCLRLACDDCENMSLAYANRSSCFLHMQMYDQCLTDIELARKANYPERLMHKLIEREATCLKLIEGLPQMEERLKPALDFEADDQLPGMANAVAIRHNDEFGTHLVANSDIDVGKTILLEEAFVFDAFESQRSYCKNCLKFCKCFIPCPNCSDVMFCDRDCMTAASAIHHMTCEAVYHKMPRVTSIIESILIAVNAFPNVGELMEFVETAVATRDFNQPQCDSVMQAKYKVFLKLFAIIEDEPNSMLTFQTLQIYHLILNIPRANAYFGTMRTQRFLMHLIWQHHFIIKTNCFAYGCTSQKVDDIQIMGNISSLFNHSCAPNVAFGKYANQMIAYTVRPVKKGQQLFIKYAQQLSAQAKQNVQDRFHFKCKCSKCVTCHKPEEHAQMQLDLNYHVILGMNNSMISNHDMRSMLKETCIEFLRKFGHLPWSPELERATIQLQKCISADLIDNQL